MKNLKKAKLVCIGLIFVAAAYALIVYMSEGANDTFIVSLAIAGIPLGGILSIWGVEAVGDGKKALGIFEYISALVCVIACLAVILLKL